jgi:hypothetical protein
MTLTRKLIATWIGMVAVLGVLPGAVSAQTAADDDRIIVPNPDDYPTGLPYENVERLAPRRPGAWVEAAVVRSNAWQRDALTRVSSEDITAEDTDTSFRKLFIVEFLERLFSTLELFFSGGGALTDLLATEP